MIGSTRPWPPRRPRPRRPALRASLRRRRLPSSRNSPDSGWTYPPPSLIWEGVCFSAAKLPPRFPPRGPDLPGRVYRSSSSASSPESVTASLSDWNPCITMLALARRPSRDAGCPCVAQVRNRAEGALMFKRILIANRGEIAVRIIRACREMGIESVAVFSDVDRKALHVRKADYAYHIGPATASESYLNFDRILDVARRSGAEAIHPGYGFLSENARFARACRDAGFKFIGPTPESMEMMGSKTSARQHMKKAGVPFVPGSEKGMEYEATERMAEQVGYPVMLKAAAGGGGKGMRLVHSPAELRSAYDSARSEAQRSFGDNEVYLEKAIVNPRHVEMQ